MAEESKKNPFVSAILSLFFPGLGQLYNEAFLKGILLIIITISSIVTIVHTGISIGTNVIHGEEMIPPAGMIVRIVTAALIILCIWVYGIIDGISGANKFNVAVANHTPNPDSGNKTITLEKKASVIIKKETTSLGLGVFLIICGLILLLVQFGLSFDFLIQFGWPIALIILGGYLLFQSLTKKN